MKNIYKHGVKTLGASKFDLKMRLTTLLLFLALFQVQANTYSQNTKITLNLVEVSVGDVLDEIESLTKFKFFLDTKQVDLNRKVSINEKKTRVSEILKKMFLGSNISFQVLDKQIVLKPNKLKVINESSNLINQETTIKGTVTDVNGTPLIGASIIEKGTSSGTITDVDGNYTLTVSNDAVLSISYLGFVSQEVPTTGKTTIDIVMVEDVSQLDEIVLIGYGTQKRKDVTGAVTSVSNEDFNQGIIISPEQLLQGKVAGVNVISASGEPGSNQSITIRGQGSIRAGSAPLFVVDGFALDNTNTGAPTNPLNFINSQDIESIDILKDASATAIYGSRGANGVVLITTKRGKEGISKMSFSSSLGISNLAREIDVFSADEFRKNVTAIGGALEDFGGNTNWQKELTRTAISHNQNLVLSGGTNKLTYYASLGVQNQQGVVKNSDLKRFSGRVNVTQKLLDDRLKIDFNLNATRTTIERPDNKNIIREILTFNPTLPAYDGNGNPSVFADVFNPLTRLDVYDDISNTRRIIANISPSLKIMDGLVYKLNVGIDNTSSDRDIQEKGNTLPLVEGGLNSIFVNSRNTLIENYLTYTFDVEDHNISLLGGHSYQEIFVHRREWSIDLFPDNGIDPRFNPGLGQELDLVDNSPVGFAIKNELQSFFGRVNYSYNYKYLFTATVRTDGSSKFGRNHRYGVFPSFAGGWRITAEDFMKSSPFSNLKLRVGWGKTGNQEIPPKITKALFTTSVSGSSSYPLDNSGNFPAGTTFVRFANPDIQWEVSIQTNIGLDFGFLDGALTGTIDYFNKVSDNILLQVVPSDPIQPASTFWTNVEDMTITNKGLELALDYSIKNDEGFSYGLGGNITSIDNVVENSPFTVLTTGSATGAGLSSATINGYVNGEPIGAFYMKDFVGINPDGTSQFRDVNGDGLDTDEDRTMVGSALPNMLYNFYANFNYKRFDFNVNFNGVSGNKIYDNTANANFFKARLAKSLNTTASAIEFPEESIENSAPVSTRFLKNASFLRLNNMSLGYNFDTSTVGIGDWIKELRLSVTGQNLFVITDYDGYDPEVNEESIIGGIASFGIDKQSYPKDRTIIFGLNISF